LIQGDKKKQILQSLFKDKMNPLVMEAFALITHKNRSSVLATIGEEYIQLYRRLHNITEVQVITAGPVSEATRSSLLTKIQELLARQAGKSNTTISLVEKIDPTLIGGFILKAGDLQYDQSFSESLRRLSQQFNSNPYIKN
jgi:F-type H+-transporting ATPase subunit delta